MQTESKLVPHRLTAPARWFQLGTPANSSIWANSGGALLIAVTVTVAVWGGIIAARSDAAAAAAMGKLSADSPAGVTVNFLPADNDVEVGDKLILSGLAASPGFEVTVQNQIQSPASSPAANSICTRKSGFSGLHMLAEVHFSDADRNAFNPRLLNFSPEPGIE